MYDPNGSLDNAERHIYNIGVGKIVAPEWNSDEIVANILKSCASFTVRDHVSRWLCLEWPFKTDPGLTYYPEKNLPADFFLTDMLPNKPLLGISITGQSLMQDALRRNVPRVQAMLSQFRGYAVVPIVSTNHAWESEEDDAKGFMNFADLFLREFEIVVPQMLDKKWWNDNLSPLRLKGVISKCKFLISQRKHNIIHAIGAKVPFVAIHPARDDSLVRILYSLHSEIQPTSGLLSLP
jgi:hypothetical protein